MKLKNRFKKSVFYIFKSYLKLSDHGGIYLNERLYVELEMYDPMKRNEIVLSVQDWWLVLVILMNHKVPIALILFWFFENLWHLTKTCYATDSPELSQMDIFHYLISSMCAHPGDETVQIHSNGLSDKARVLKN